MSQKTLYLLHIAAKLFFTVALLFFPVFFHGLYGNTYSLNGIRLGRYLAVFMVAVSYLAWQFRNHSRGDVTKIFSTAMAFEWGAIGVFFLIHTLQGGYNFLGWITTGLSVVFTGLFISDIRQLPTAKTTDPGP